MKYKVKNNDALDYCMSVEIRDCQDIVIHSPLYDEQAKHVYFSESEFTLIRSENIAILNALSFTHDDFSGIAVIKVGGGTFHYFMVQKECVNQQNFFRIFQAYDTEYSLQDWLQDSRQWGCEAKDNFGKGQWLSQDKFGEFITNIERIISLGDTEAFYKNFGVHTAFEDDVFISVNAFPKKYLCTETITLEEIPMDSNINNSLSPLLANSLLASKSGTAHQNNSVHDLSGPAI